MPKLIGEVTLTFIRGGLASKTGKPYLQCSNGRETFFVTIPKSVTIDADTFADLQEDDQVTLEVEVLVGSPNVKFLSLVS